MITSEERIAQLAAVFQELGDASLEVLAHASRERQLAAGERLVKEGERPTCLWVIASGSVELCADDVGQATALVTLGAGELLGAMSALDGAPYASSARASLSGGGVALIELRLEALEQLTAPERALVRGVLGEHVSRIARRKGALLATLLGRRRAEIAFMLVGFVILAATVMAAGVLTQLFTLLASTTYVLLVYLVGVCALLGHFLWRARPDATTLGLARGTTWRRNVAEGLVVALVVCGLLTLLKWAATSWVPAWSHLPVIDALNLENSRALPMSARVQVLITTIIGYGLAGFVQEFVARGVLQGQLEHILEEPGFPWRAILLSNLVFAAVHAVWSIQLMILSFLGGVLWGTLYLRHRDIYGVGLSHGLVGIWGLKILNIPALYHIWPL